MAIIDFLGEIAAIAGAVCFGVSNVIIKSQGDKIKPMGINAIRLTLSALIYLVILLATGTLQAAFSFSLDKSLLIVGGTVIGVVLGDIIFFYSQQLVGLSIAYPIAVSYPLLTYIVQLIMGTERFSWIQLTGIVIVITGVYLVSSSTKGQEIRRKRREEQENNVAVEELVLDEMPEEEIVSQEGNDLNSKAEDSLLTNNFAVAATTKTTTDLQALNTKPRKTIILGITGAAFTAICWTAGTILMDLGLTEDISGITANAFRMICIAPLGIMVFATTNWGKNKSKFSWKGFGLIVLAGLIGSTLGGLLYVFALSYSSAYITAAVTASAPLIATPLAIVLLKEKLTIKLIIGTVLTVIGIWLIIIF